MMTAGSQALPSIARSSFRHRSIVTPRWSLAGVAAVLLAATAAAAADVQLAYVVHDKPLKQAVSGTLLTFDLYSDPTCTTAVHSFAELVDNVLIERIRRFKPKGAATPVMTARLTHVASATPPAGGLYMVVTGTGITPVGAACQVQYSSTVGTALPCARQEGNEVIFEGCNVNVRDGSGSTSYASNGLGNLRIGYNERSTCELQGDVFCTENDDCYPNFCSSGECSVSFDTCTTDADCPANTCSPPLPQDGSHNLIVGPLHSYDNANGNIIGGSANTVTSSSWAAVLAGTGNVIDNAIWSAILGGSGNLAEQTNYGTVVGGRDNVARELWSTVVGGKCNRAGFGPRPSGCSIFPGEGLQTVLGGLQNQASGAAATVAGGSSNLSAGQLAAVGGGTLNEARSTVSSVVGGQCNVAGAGPKLASCVGLTGSNASTVSGGFQNLASGNHSSVTGGNDNTASGGSSVVSSGNGSTQATGFGWSAGAFGTLINGRIVSP